MKTPLKYFLTAFLSIQPLDSYAFPEIPFCPAGGPPGWLNHFNYKRDQKLWRLQHRRYQYNTPQRYVYDYYSPSYRPRTWQKLENPGSSGHTILPSTPSQHKTQE